LINQIEPQFGIEEASALKDYILRGGWGTEHTYTEIFERKIADFVGVKYCSAVNNGTIGLILALLSVGIKPGDRVIVPALTMVATANAVRFIGAEPVFADIEKNTLCLDTDEALKIEAKAVIYVSLNGRCGEIERLKGKFILIEDACQSLGSYHNGKALGTIGDIGVYSLSPHKIISTGQGGLVVTNNKELHDRVERFKDFGRLRSGSDDYSNFGINAKFTDFQAVIGIEQLKKIKWRIRRKKKIYALYKKLIHSLVILDNKEEVTPWMVDVYGDIGTYKGFKTRPMYPVVPHTGCYNERKEYPISQLYSHNGMWIPSSVTLTDKQIYSICEEING